MGQNRSPNMMYSVFMLASLSVVSGFMVQSPVARSASRASSIQMANLIDTASGLQGSEIFWGSDGPTLDPPKEESDIKGYDNFDSFVAAIDKFGLTDELKSGEYTLLLPVNSCLEGKELTADIVKYHIMKGKIPVSGLEKADLTTLQGDKLTYQRMFRKDFLDDAMVGVKSEGPSKSSNFPCDVEADNGIIHTLNMLLVPGEF